MKHKRTEKRISGDFGEDIALKFLMKHKFSLISRNYLKPWGEIDIIAKRRDVMHFIEVKSVLVNYIHKSDDNVIRETDSYRPEENVHYQKLKRLSRVIQTYILENNVDQDLWQFDVIVVEVMKDFKKAKVKFLEDIVL